jgi:hypothetical protein
LSAFHGTPVVATYPGQKGYGFPIIWMRDTIYTDKVITKVIYTDFVKNSVFWIVLSLLTIYAIGLIVKRIRG